MLYKIYSLLFYRIQPYSIYVLDILSVLSVCCFYCNKIHLILVFLPQFMDFTWLECSTLSWPCPCPPPIRLLAPLALL